jgi:restriction system protein
MIHSPVPNEMLWLWWVIPTLLLLAVVRSAWFKGWRGEAFVKRVARRRLPAESYHPLHDVTLATPDGTTQIDHIFVSRFGIFVVETKNMNGWIFGGESQAQWTQTLFRRSFKFQNPLRQNYKHVKAVQAVAHMPSNAIHSVVVFVGRSTFKSAMPRNVTRHRDCFTYITSFRDPLLSDSQVQRTVTALQAARLRPTRRTRREHVQALRARADTFAERKCPRCGSSMVVRTARRGNNAGNQFWGCSAFPACRVVQIT